MASEFFERIAGSIRLCLGGYSGMRVDLVHKARSGDQQAFEELATAAVDRLYATAALILHDRTLGEDAVQETLLRAWGSLPQLRDPERFEAWLRGILVHACMDVARLARRDRQVRELPMNAPDDSDFAAAIAERDAIAKAFDQLSPDHRAVFVLRHFDGLSVPEIAQILRVPLGTAKSRLHYADQAMVGAMDADARRAPTGGVS